MQQSRFKTIAGLVSCCFALRPSAPNTRRQMEQPADVERRSQADPFQPNLRMLHPVDAAIGGDMQS